MNLNLNQNETKVLIACVGAIVDASDFTFGCIDEINAEGISTNQLKGYLSVLKQKNAIELHQTEPSPQVYLTKVGADYLLESGNLNDQYKQYVTKIKEQIV